MLVVLLILATLTAIAVESTQMMVEPAKFEATKSTLENIRHAIVSVKQNSAATSSLSGFAVDLGSAPTALEQLLEPPAGVASVPTPQLLDSDGDGVGDTTAVSGWNGPYLRLPMGTSTLSDGWNRSLALLLSSSPGEPLVKVASFGSDGVLGTSGDPFSADTSLDLFPVDLQAAALTFRLYELDGGGSKVDPTTMGGEVLELRIFGVNPATGLYELATPSLSPSFEATLTSVPVGRIVVRAVKKSGSTILKRSVPLTLSVMPGAVESYALVLQ